MLNLSFLPASLVPFISSVHFPSETHLITFDISNHAANQARLMDQALNPYDLRDDEYMMVEDEFLQTAKLFTRHLHLAEYERLKSLVQSKINNGQEITRPVLANVQVPEERKMKMRAEERKKAQREALRSVLEGEEDEEEEVGGSGIGLARTKVKGKGKGKGSMARDTTSDSSDLDATPRPKPLKRAQSTPRQSNAPPSSPPDATLTFLKPVFPASKSRPSTTTSHTSRYTATTATTAAASSSFDAHSSTKTPSPRPSTTKPAPHTSTSTNTTTAKQPRTRHRSGRSLSDLLDDDFDPPTPTASTPKAAAPSKVEVQPTTKTPVTQRKSSSLTSIGSVRTSQPRPECVGSSDTGNTLQRRRSRDRLKGREKEGKAEEDRRGSITLDDIPTFLF